MISLHSHCVPLHSLFCWDQAWGCLLLLLSLAQGILSSRRHWLIHFAFSFRNLKLNQPAKLQQVGEWKGCEGQAFKGLLNYWEIVHRNPCGYVMQGNLMYRALQLAWNSPHHTLIIWKLRHSESPQASCSQWAERVISSLQSRCLQGWVLGMQEAGLTRGLF